jgi:hypothetical protein
MVCGFYESANSHIYSRERETRFLTFCFYFLPFFSFSINLCVFYMWHLNSTLEVLMCYYPSFYSLFYVPNYCVPNGTKITYNINVAPYFFD